MQSYAFFSIFRHEIRLVVWVILALYAAFVFFCVRALVKDAKTRRGKLMAGSAALAVVFVLPVGGLTALVIRGQMRAKAAYAERDAAYARLRELCKSSGEFIYRTAENVDGVFLMKLRPTTSPGGDKWAEDPFGSYRDGGDVHEGISEPYLRAFLNPLSQKPPYPYYSYVDLISPVDGKRYRYTGHIVYREGRSHGDFQLRRAEVTRKMPIPRYGVTFDDITEHADRERWWIAGSSLRVIDLKTKEVMGERIGYMMVSWLGGQSLAESYGWNTWTTGCPYEMGLSPTMFETRNFIRRVINPRNRGDKS